MEILGHFVIKQEPKWIKFREPWQFYNFPNLGHIGRATRNTRVSFTQEVTYRVIMPCQVRGSYDRITLREDPNQQTTWNNDPTTLSKDADRMIIKGSSSTNPNLNAHWSNCQGIKRPKVTEKKWSNSFNLLQKGNDCFTLNEGRSNNPPFAMREAIQYIKIIRRQI